MFKCGLRMINFWYVGLDWAPTRDPITCLINLEAVSIDLEAVLKLGTRSDRNPIRRSDSDLSDVVRWHIRCGRKAEDRTGILIAERCCGEAWTSWQAATLTSSSTGHSALRQPTSVRRWRSTSAPTHCYFFGKACRCKIM